MVEFNNLRHPLKAWENAQGGGEIARQ